MNSLNRKYIPFISTLIFILSISFMVKANVNPVVDDANLLSRKKEIIAAVQTANFGALPQRFMGEKP